MRIATRGSALALWQARRVCDLLSSAGVPEVQVVVIETAGDRDLTSPLHAIGGKGVFVKEVQVAVLNGRADLAVHSAKDLPAATPEGLALGAIPVRANPLDALVGARLSELESGARIGTGSVRRRAQLAALRPDLEFAELRGNIATRLDKLDRFDAIVMAAAAIERLDLKPAVVDVIAAADMIPQVGQGALAVECRTNDAAARAALEAIDDPAIARLVNTERGFLTELGGDCSLPAAAHASARSDGDVDLRAFLASDDLSRHHQIELTGTAGAGLGVEAARMLLDQLGVR